MAKKETLKRDDFDLDNDLDFNEFDFGDNDGSYSKDVKSKKRNPVTDVLIGTIGGIKDTVKSPSFLAETVKDVLPKQYGTVFQGLGEISDGVTSLYDDAVKEIKPQVSKLAKKIDRLVPEESKTLKKITTKIKDFIGDPDASYSGPSKEEIQEQSITNALGAIFSEQAEKNDQIKAREYAKEEIRENINSKRFDSNFTVLSSINEQVVKLGNYNEKINQAYQKKTLELQFRGYFIQSELLDTTKRFFDLFEKQNESIVKNTALPEFVKLQESERFKEIAKNKFYGSLFGNESIIGRGIKNLKAKAKQEINDFKNSFESIISGVETIDSLFESQREMEESGLGSGLSKSSLIGSMAGGYLANYLKDKTVKVIKDNIPEDIQKELEKIGYTGKNTVNNLPGFLSELQNHRVIQDNINESGLTGILAKLSQGLIQAFKDKNIDMELNRNTSLGTLNEASVFNNKTQLSITEIIPGYLSRIYRELRITRTGYEGIGLTLFDYDKGTFESEQTIKDSINKKLTDKAKNSMVGFSINDVYYKMMAGSGKLDKDKEIEIKSFLLDIAGRKNQSFEPDAILKSSAFEELSDPVKEILSNIFESKYKEEENEDRFENTSELISGLRKIKNNTTSYLPEIEEYYKAGYVDQLKESGFIKDNKNGGHLVSFKSHQDLTKKNAIGLNDNTSLDRVENDIKEYIGDVRDTEQVTKFVKNIYERGNAKELYQLGVINTLGPTYKINTKRFIEIKESSTTASSDISLKRNILKFKPKDALNAIKKTNVYKWFYKEGKGPEGEFVGPMAQDVKQNMGEEVAPEGKKLNLISANGINQAAIQALSERMDQLGPVSQLPERKQTQPAEDKKTGIIELIKSIKDDTTELVSLNKQAMRLAINLGDLPEEAKKAFASGKEYVVNKATEAKDKVKEKGNEYAEAAGTLLKTGGELAGKIASDAVSGITNAFTFVKDKIANPLYKGTKDFFNEDRKKAIGERINKTTALVFDNALLFTEKALNLTKDVLFKKLPAGMDILANLIKKGKDKFAEMTNYPLDVYIKGLESPVLKAQLMKTGYYIDQSTKKVILGVKDLMNIKGNIITPNGDVVLTREEMQDGIFDKEGKPVDTIAGKVIKTLAAGAIAGVARGYSAVKTALGAATTTGKGIGDFVKNKLNFKQRVKDIISSMPQFDMSKFSVGFGSEKIYDVLEEIRDTVEYGFRVLAPKGAFKSKSLNHFKKNKQSEKQKDKPKTTEVQKEETTTEEKSEDKSFFGQLKAGYQESKKVISEKLNQYKDKPEELSKEVKDRAIEVGDRLKTIAENTKAKADAKLNDNISTDENFVGPVMPGKVKASNMMESAKQTIKTDPTIVKILKTVTDILKKKEEEPPLGAIPQPPQEDTKEEVVEENETAKPDLTPKYTEGGSSGGLLSMGAGLLGKATEKIGSVKAALPAIKAAPGIKGKALALAGSLFTGKGKSEEEKPTEEQPEQKPEHKEEPKKESIIKRIKNKAKDKISSAGAFVKKAFNDRDASGKRDGSWEEQLKKKEEASKNRESKMAKPDLDPKYRSRKNIIDTMMEKMSGLMGSIGEGASGIFGTVGKVLGTVTDWLGGGKKGIIGKIGSVLGKAILGPFKLLMRGGGLLKGALGVGGTVLRVGAGLAMPLLSGLGSLALTAGGAIVSAVGGILASPVLLGALAVAAVGAAGYYGYKYFTRDKLDEFQDIRVKQYGLTNSESDKKFNHQLMNFEGYLIDTCVEYGDKGAYIAEKRIDSEKALGYFDIDIKDQNMVNIFAKWFNGRFKPFFLTHLTALRAINPRVKLYDLDKLKLDEKIKYLKLISFESGPYEEETSPFKDLPKLNTDRKLALDAITALIDKLSKEEAKDKKEAKPGEKKDENKQAPGAIDTKKPELPLPAPVVEPPKLPKRRPEDVIKEAGMINAGEEGQQPKPLGAVADSVPKATEQPPIAAGSVKDGSGANQYIKLNPNAKLSGLNPEMLNNFKGMVQEYGETTGKNVIVTSGARDSKEQEALYKKNPKLAAPPGRSLHEFGLAMDVNSTDLNRLEELGLMKKYGFTRPVGGEPWHMEPAGIQIGVDAAKKDPNKAAELIASSLGKGGGGVGTIQGAPKGRRDANVALALLNAPGKEIKNDKDSVSSTLLAKAPVQQTEDKVASVTPQSGFMKTSLDASRSDTPKQPSTLTEGNKYSLNDKLPEPDAPKPQVQTGSAVPVTSDASGKNSDVKQIITEAAKTTGVDPNIMKTFAAVESGFNPNARASTSSATGLFQFTQATWNEQLGKHGRKYNIPPNASPTDPRANSLLAGELIKSNLKSIESVKPNPTATDAYLTHFLGAGGARTFLAAEPTRPAAEVMPRAAEANKPIFFNKGVALTIADVYKKLENKLRKAAQSFGINLNIGSSDLASKPQEPTKQQVASTSLSKETKPQTNILQPSQPPSVTPGVSDTSTVAAAKTPEAVSENKQQTRKPVLVPPQQNTVIGTAPIQQNSYERSSANDNFNSGINTVNDTMVKSLNVQSQMLDVLRQILSNVNPENFKEFKESLNKSQPPGQDKGGYLDRGPALRQLPNPSVDLRRRQV